MRIRRLTASVLLAIGTVAADDFPIVPGNLQVSIFAKDPLVRNPCAITFDAQGRLCVGMGPQYRNPTPETPGDSVFILIDSDGDGTADRRQRFATGFNAIQGLAWKGDKLYVANAPDFTVVRDTDGDDVADEYVRLYTDLGNLEHGLHGLNWAPDGKLYMSKGNSKGLNQSPDRVAPQAFRELWGMASPTDAPEFPSPLTFGKADYQKNYHDPSDDWGLCGGVLRCDGDGSNLEIVARGFRNPWDIAFDDSFNWLGTDNDQTHGDKFFSPFFGAHFGWGHPWSYAWKGDDHLPSAPSAGPLFEGSGTGVIYCEVPGYPDQYRGVFLVNDWLRREVYLYRPRWDGAWLKPDQEKLDLLAHAGGGRSMGQSSGRSFDPVDIEIGPDGAIYISSWGRQYGTLMKGGQIANEGRIYKIWPKDFKLSAVDPKHQKPITSWTREQLIADLGHYLPVWRTNAQQELVRRGKAIEIPTSSSRQLQTWGLWTNGLMAAGSDFLTAAKTPENIRVQSLRILAHRAEQPETIAACLNDQSARIRHEAVLALHQSGASSQAEAILSLAATEQDRVVFYSAWQALRALLPQSKLKLLLGDQRAGVRRAALLALLEDDALNDQELTAYSKDEDAVVAALADKRRGGKAQGIIKGGSLGAVTKAATRSLYRPLQVVSDIQPRRSAGYQQATLQDGALAYNDRPYRLSGIPASLAGATFIRAANNDADLPSGTGFALDLLYPSTVYLADDKRGEKLPAWARGRFEKTDLTFTAGDANYTLHKAQHSAGQTSFGPNREDVNGRKAHYIVIVQPQTFKPPKQPTTQESVMPLIAKADIEHGRNLFFQTSGATCSLCHRLEDRGNVFAPDLSGIGARADAAFIVRSILQPSAEITEGFAMQVMTRNDGTTVGGIVLEETGQSVKVSPGGGQVIEVAKSDIAKRQTADISAMPAIFHTMLSPGDVAAITAYLLKSKPTPAPTSKPSAPANTDQLAGANFGKPSGFQITRTAEQLAIQYKGESIASYFYRHAKVWRPFFANLRSLRGTQVTRNFPPLDGDPNDHWDMHPGLSLGFAVLDGVNFWHNREGKVVHGGFSNIAAGVKDATFATINRYLNAAGEEICVEAVTYTIITNADGYLIISDSKISAKKPIYFGVKEEMGLALRVATPISVKFGKGSILGAAGGINEKGTWGKVDSWWDCFGPIGDSSAGVQIMSAPGNPKVWAHSRDYGVLVANPFPVDVAKNRGKRTDLPAGETLHLQFGVQIHEHQKREHYDPMLAHQRFLDTIQK